MSTSSTEGRGDDGVWSETEKPNSSRTFVTFAYQPTDSAGFQCVTEVRPCDFAVAKNSRTWKRALLLVTAIAVLHQVGMGFPSRERITCFAGHINFLATCFSFSMN